MRIKTMTLDEYIKDYATTNYPKLKVDNLDSIQMLEKIKSLRSNKNKK